MCVVAGGFQTRPYRGVIGVVGSVSWGRIWVFGGFGWRVLGVTGGFETLPYGVVGGLLGLVLFGCGAGFSLVFSFEGLADDVDGQLASPIEVVVIAASEGIVLYVLEPFVEPVGDPDGPVVVEDEAQGVVGVVALAVGIFFGVVNRGEVAVGDVVFFE